MEKQLGFVKVIIKVSSQPVYFCVIQFILEIASVQMYVDSY